MGKLDYLEQQIEIGKLVGKEDETRAWAEDFEKRAADIGSKIKEKHGEETTVTVIETDGKRILFIWRLMGKRN